MRGTRHSSLWVIPEVLHDLMSAAGLLVAVREDVDARLLSDGIRLYPVLVKRRARCVGDYEQPAPGVCLLERFEALLSRVLAANGEQGELRRDTLYGL